mmetsp:Transcript_24508/g.39898  ORF Transcript_24508/g.39898 Transcript_24508/m.39898 type:complete len:256 (-) Transcript_24508:1605-2372(-)|eukprot:CAMPEP_0203759356 /NCGR_PEP_ID=MMETSP0098-20131031/12326_1 /ASSEMBLY_ACC=CAM_ASM_000208 /TAXON_ID=96639 /ORGANISM=" , Strain NY0313808BC1" /LENGTH=255 /DNA_ID=CAMNT_0050652225 /DNA_START=417 /DNA_END=1184 /DNA_ORIENTATION=+
MEEIEILKEIYTPEELTVVGEQKIVIKIGQAKVTVMIPKGYPQERAPVIELNGWPKMDDVQHIVQELEAMFQIGDFVIFTWIEHLRELYNNIQDKAEGQQTKEEQQTEEEQQAQEEQTKSTQHTQLEKQLEIISGQPLTFRKSTFQAHLAVIQQASMVECFLNQLKQDRKIAKATHNIMAYRIERSDRFTCDNDDDGENAAGSRLAHLLEILDARNVVVVVTRWYGGVPLGPTRFKLINNAARQLLDECNLIKSA